jgi:succinate-semialdehyde dehydrogenase/glutarate-semialdehyde dehydrogenase
MSIKTLNPATGESLASYGVHSAADLDRIFALAASTQRTWRETNLESRTQMLLKVAQILESEKASLAGLMHREMGKTLSEAEAEVVKCAACAKYYAEQGPAFLQNKDYKTEASRSFVAFEPIGVVYAVMPWNFPLWQVFRCAVPATLAGNTVVLKHASNVTGCALEIERIFRQAAGQKGLMQSVLLAGKDALALIDRPEVRGVSFTGSTPVGREIASAAGKALKKSVLELGGSDAYVVLADADLEAAAKACAASRLLNAGQSCISAKRFIVEASVFAEFEKLFAQELKGKNIAPLAREDLRKDLHEQVQKSLKAGAQLLCGGQLPSTPGYHYPPTLLTNVQPGMAVFEEETFGPVAALVKASSAEDAIRLANLSSFGLGAAIFTKDDERGAKLAQKQLEAGSCFVNDFVKSDPRLPFGGAKDSGYGRELADFGIHEFVNIKTIYVK